MEVDGNLQENHEDHNGSTTEASLACNCCRRRKLRCSREVPTCQHCRKTATECVYEAKRAKPGMKTGAIDNLHRRLDALEKLVHQKSISDAERTRSQSAASQSDIDASPYHLLSFFTKEFQKFIESREQAPGSPPLQSSGPGTGGGKRRRLDGDLSYHAGLGVEHARTHTDEEQQLILDAYFTHLHPWIPMIHEARFRQRLSDVDEQKDLQIIIHAMILAATKYIKDSEVAASFLPSQSHMQQLRDSIVATAMRQLTVENSQALLIVAFNDIGCGLAAQAWSIVGALTRNVEYLQLATENDETDRLRLSQPFASLSPPKDWTEAEERRRVFWNVFNLDRLCSVMTGWNTSLTSDDVNRRLPCDGIKWRKEDAVVTPYFGIWDKSAGRIGNPLLLLPPYYPATGSQPVDQPVQTPSDTGTSPGAPAELVDMSTVGAFAYSIEATESLSRVTTYFLQQRVNMHDLKDLSSWLTRFKELDLRLIHWKMLLPHKWKVDVTRQHSRMDPNLTLAHVTHNASMILLHQLIAFPLSHWPFKNRLPSLCSADTCHAAAVEISIIAENYLKNAPAAVPVSTQFAFCLYVASRALLLHSRHSKGAGLAPQFWSLVDSLKAMARRWVGPNAIDADPSQVTSIAEKYAQKLTDMYSGITKDPYFQLSVLGYTNEIDHSSPLPVSPMGRVQLQDQEKSYQSSSSQPLDFTYSMENIESLDAAHTPGASTERPRRRRNQPQRLQHQDVPVATELAGDSIRLSIQSAVGPGEIQPVEQPHAYTGGIVDLGSISQLLLDQQFMDMDRIISYDDGMFGAEY
ncbi:unnamed protein product [Clonostachys rhizophaga]|uniref:Zn(2)-C6 fungal-type domain-containing protein n=1 Tax=Clonostachys rhizophaga TaxID=160324 RepID=A0A9N9W162_9HYPO|nr:unnamed protein product [Clonostachys rhizophaga]